MTLIEDLFLGVPRRNLGASLKRSMNKFQELESLLIKNVRLFPKTVTGLQIAELIITNILWVRS